MVKQIKWLTPNKMEFESLHKTFNRQTKCINRGNVIGNTQIGGYIRPYNETNCNGQTFPKGHLQNYDLNWLVKDLPETLKQWIREYAKDKSVIAYIFRHFQGGYNGKKILDGFVIITTDHKLLRVVYANNSLKSISAIDECIKYIIE